MSAPITEATSLTSTNTNNNNNNNNNRENDDENERNGFPPQSQLSCPIDVSCLWTGPSWALKSWASSAAGLFGLNSTSSGGDERRNPRYVPITTSTDTLDGASVRSVNSDENNNNNNSKNKSTRSSLIAEINPNFGSASLFSGILGSNNNYLHQNPMVAVSGEFEVWQKYIKDLSNFAAIDVDVAIIASSTDRASPNPYVHLTIRGPIIPSLGRCRRTLENSAFITPQTQEEWSQANPIAVMEVVEAFLLSVVAPESVEDDDAIETIIETGTHILAHPAVELQEFLKGVAEFVKEKCIGVKLVIRDIDFTAEFESARQQHTERFLVLETNATSQVTIAREPRTTSSSSIMGNMFSSPLGVAKTLSGGIDHGSCPDSAVAAFEADYTMLDIVRAVRNLIKRVIQNISTLKSIEVRGCLMRDTDLDVNGIFAGRSSVVSIQEHQENENQETEDENTSRKSPIQEYEQTNAKSENEIVEGRNSSDHDDENDDFGDGKENRCFPYRTGIVQSKIKRISGPTRLVIEHCGLTDSHLAALVRLLRIETEKTRRNTTTTTTNNEKENNLMTIHFLCSLSSLRVSGQFFPLTLVGLLSGMQDCFDDAKLNWAKNNHSKNSKTVKGTAEERAARIPFPLEEVELPASSVHTVRNAIQSRGFGSNITCRSTD